MTANPLLRRAARVLRAGGIVAYPTEAVYGLGCNPDDEAALRRLIAIKGRSARAGFILIAATAGQLQGWIAPTAAEQRRLASPTRTPVTWVVRAGARAGRLLTGRRATVAVRITTHPVAAGLCRAAGMPLVSTSANYHGRPPARTALGVRRRLGRELDLIVPGPTGGRLRPSEIRLAATGEVLRRG
ncbi:MAG: Sua5/YciO/YrdC/YwlC family protein [Gammaproteobacteria bacterium]|nr:Sua5/YciO/YrdC/YwlC family protein [Gammaproteobacteria bacterium]